MFNIPNILTAFNLLSGCFAILFAIAGRIDIAPFLLFLAAFFDFLDGFVARKMGVSGILGKQLDSLADMVSFGLAPGIIMMVVMVTTIYIDGPFFTPDFVSHVHLQWLNWINALFYAVPNSMDASIKYLPLTALFIPFMSMFRLAKFNIDERQTDSFIGVPTPMNTFFLMFFPLTLWLNYENWRYEAGIFEYIFNSYVLVGVIVVMGLLLVAELPLFALKLKHFKWKENEVRYIFVGTSLLLILTLRVWSIPLIVILYIILSVINNKYSKTRNNEI